MEFNEDIESWITEFGELFFSDDENNEWSPTTDMEEAWKVFEKFIQWNCWIEVAFSPKSKKYRCLIGTNYANKKLQSVDVSADTASLAICLAALKAHGIEVKD
jgi:hypothetical protein